ncbi:piezo-type mechanosensitive ion channel component 1-like [Babylonia areolata]|uniref:piezo-type mechanosensitive ion channel component 1-like n=1 Tax=Babylonia areolata TaxID=304850 RepID=UPI003FCFA514
MAAKVTSVVCFCLFRVLLPLTLLAAAVVRYNALSFMYLVCLLVTPLLSYPMVSSMAGHTGRFLKAMIGLSALPVLGHIIFHITLVSIATESEPYGSIFPNCSKNEKLARQFGFQRLDNVPYYHGIRLILPDVAVLAVSIVVLVVSAVLIRRDVTETNDLPMTSSYVRRKRKMASVLNYVGEFFVGLLLAVCGIMVPSALSSVYFLMFLALCVLWACYHSLGRRFAVFRILLLVYSAAHILTLHLYQFQFFQEALPRKDFVARLLGLTGIIQTNCARVYEVDFYPGVRWMAFVNPGVLLLLYWVLAVETRYWYNTKDLTSEEMLAGSLGVTHKQRKRRRPMNAERQVSASKDLDEWEIDTPQRTIDSEWGIETPQRCIDSETGSLVFSGSTYGDDGDDERLVDDEGENVNYNSMGGQEADGTGGEGSGAGPSGAGDDALLDVEGEHADKGHTGSFAKRAPLVSIFMFAMKQSYVLMLIAMMAWSIMYLSWLTFVLLLVACLLWMLPNSRRASLVTSPLLVVYALGLLLAQYAFNMDLKPELPTMAGAMTIKEIGLVHFDTPPKDLAFHILFTMFFMMSLRQFMRERRPASEQPAGYPMHSRTDNVPIEGFNDLMNLGFHDSMDGYDSATIRVFGRFLMEVLSKYWIFVCAGMLLLMAVQEVVIYRIIYMILFLLFVICFQVSYPLWRALMFAFWWLVIVYSMGVLIILYTYQFELFPGYWQNNTGWDNNTLADIGLEKFNGTELFIKLLTPTSFLIVIILQVHYFHKPFLRLSATDRYRREEEAEAANRYNQWVRSWCELMTSETETEDEECASPRPKEKGRFKMWLARTQILVKMADFWDSLTTFLWRLAEIHIFKVVVLTVMLVAVQEDQVSALTAVYVIFVMLLLPFVLTKAHLVLSNLIIIWTCIIILAKMLYQLRLVPHPQPEICDALNSSGVLEPKSEDNFIWLGFRKITTTGETIDYYIRLYILVLIVVLFESIVRYHQRQHFSHPDHPKLEEGIIFGGVHREHADEGIISCLKFFINYAFYKFGLEICYVTTAVTVCIRMDVFGVVYTVLLAIMMLFSRGASARIWWLYMLILAILLPIQFLGSLGFPPVACIVYPWHNLTHFDNLLERWLFLPDMEHSPPTGVLMGDVFQLLFVVMQWKVFRLEHSINKQMHNGGDNKEILEEVEANMVIPVEDFTVTTTSYLDVCKQFVFEYMFWVTLAVIFITGATRINLFGLGYVIAVFLFMWYGKELLLKPLRKLLRMWNLLIAYVVFVLFAKACLQLVGCVYISKLFTNNCWVIQLFGINCLLPNKENIIEDALEKGCVIVEDNTGLTWDVVCFAFLLLQRRIYSCHYFRHIVDLLDAQSNLSSRGAELINRILLREVEKQKEQENQILVNIKKKMKFLKERQAALRKDFKEPTEHFQAIRAGDYYLFEEGTEEELEKSPGEKVPDSLTFGQDEHEDKRLGPLQVISTAIDEGTETAVDKVRAQDEPEGARPDMSPAEEKEGEDSVADKAKTWGNFFATLIGSIADWLISLCNSISRNYRLVAEKLEGELRTEKEKIKSRHKPRTLTPVELSSLEHSSGGGGDDRGSTSNPTFLGTDEPEVTREEREKMTQPVALERSWSSMDPDGTGATIPSPPDDLVEVTVEPSHPGALESRSSESLDELEARADNREKEFEKTQPRAYRLLKALLFVLVSHSELLCYFLMILDQMVYGSLLALPLPFMVFLWGMLSVPRPSKTFWITVITYTEAVVVTKYLFQFGFFPWNDGTVQESPFFPPRILGIEQKENYANVDIALLLALFIHRSILKKYGLWKDSKDITEDMAKAGQQEVLPLENADENVQDPGEEDDNANKESEQPSRFKQCLHSAVGPFVTFFKDMACSKYSATVDSYAPMFCCDFINFFIVVFGYQSFGPAQESADGDVTSYISENRVPVPFLIMLLTQFVLIVIDRALFLRKNVMGKCIFQILLVILIHIWMFFVLPKVTSRSFFDNIPAQLWYFVKCIYFALSAYQIRCGYPTRILGNFLTKKYNYVNLFAFKGFLAIPFLLELRALMDWIWTDSTLAIGSWLQMEDIYAKIFILKCWRHSESAYPTPRALKKKPVIKYGVGGLLLFVIILIIWFPLVIFAFANTVFDPNPPTEVTIQIQLGAYQPLFKMTVQQNIQNIPQSNFSSLKDYFSRDQASMSYLNRFEEVDISVISFNGESTAIWGISKPAQMEMIENLENQNKMKLEFSITVIRSSDTSSSQTLNWYFETDLSDEELLKLAEVINGTSNDTVRVNGVFPRFMQLNSKKGVSAAKPLIEGTNGFGLTNLTLGLSGEGGVGSLAKYWSIEEEVYGGSHFILNKDNPKTFPASFTNSIKLITFNDRKAPSTLSFLSGYGIISLYIGFVLVISKFSRLTFADNVSFRIMFDEMPDVDQMLELCLNVYLVREMKDYRLEEELFAKLLFIYRSPETMVRFTRHRYLIQVPLEEEKPD